MSKYTIEYLKHKLHVCCDSLCCYINLVLSEHDNNDLFVQFVYAKNLMYNCIKQVNK